MRNVYSPAMPYMWLGEAAERDPEVLMAYHPPEPMVVVDDSEGIDE